jgi:hypothetical protein
MLAPLDKLMTCIRKTLKCVDVNTHPKHFYAICFNYPFKNNKLDYYTQAAGVLEPATEENLRGRTLTRGWRKSHKQKLLVTYASSSITAASK